MNNELPFPSSSVEAISKILGDTDNGLTGSEIEKVLSSCYVTDVTPLMTKWKRIYNALTAHQNHTKSSNHIVAFIHKTVSPVLYVKTPERFMRFRDQLIPILAFSSLTLTEEGRIKRAPKANSISDALGRSNKLKSELERRSAHPEVFNYCKEELLKDSFFHAVLEAMKGIAERMRLMSGLRTDGAELARDMFTLGQNEVPLFAINPLTDDSLKSEQKRFVNLLIGMFGMFRNPTAHAPRVLWSMSESDALDMLTTISLVHRKLDISYKYNP